MKLGLTAIVAFVVCAGQLAAQERAAQDKSGKAAVKPSQLKSVNDKAWYAIGFNTGRNFKAQGMDVNSELLIQGLRDSLSGAPGQLTDDQMQETLMAFQKEMGEKMSARMKIEGEKNKKEGDAFLTANKKKEGIKVLPSGLQYKVLKNGAGAKPKPNDLVTTNYRGTFINGKEFDSSYKRKEPAMFQVKGVIPGWTEALQLMPVGSKWQLFVPSELAYGSEGYPPDIAPEATLIFELELLGIGNPQNPNGRVPVAGTDLETIPPKETAGRSK